MRSHFFVAILAVAMILLMGNEAMAGVLTPLQITCNFMLKIWVWLRGAVYVLAAIGLAFMSFQASILGRFSMGRLATWGSALFVLSSVPPILSFLSNSSMTMNCP